MDKFIVLKRFPDKITNVIYRPCQPFKCEDEKMLFSLLDKGFIEKVYQPKDEDFSTGIVVKIGIGHAAVMTEAGSSFLIYGGSFKNGRASKTRVGDELRFVPKYENDRLDMALHVEPTGYIRQVFLRKGAYSFGERLIAKKIPWTWKFGYSWPNPGTPEYKRAVVNVR
jgi:hypothetical protein